MLLRKWFLWGLIPRPSKCKAGMITATLLIHTSVPSLLCCSKVDWSPYPVLFLCSVVTLPDQCSALMTVERHRHWCFSPPSTEIKASHKERKVSEKPKIKLLNFTKNLNLLKVDLHWNLSMYRFRLKGTEVCCYLNPFSCEIQIIIQESTYRDDLLKNRFMLHGTSIDILSMLRGMSINSKRIHVKVGCFRDLAQQRSVPNIIRFTISSTF